MKRADFALALIALIWGATFVLVKAALDHVSTLLFLTLRFSVAALTLFLLFGVKNVASRKVSRAHWIAGVVTGSCLFGGYVLQTFGLRYTTPGKSGFITGLYIVLVPVFSALIYRVRPHTSELIGVALAVGGMALMGVPETGFQVNFGDLLTVGCAVFYSFHILLLGRYSKVMDYEWLTLAQLSTCALLGAATFWWAEPWYIVWNREVLIAVAVTSLLATALAFSVQTWAQSRTTPTRTALLFALEPVFALVTSYVVINEVLSGRALTGAALILAGILFVEMKPVGG
jgi:drug/metabolite transporter (DMT)-like permease